MQKTGQAFGSSEASGKIVRNEIFESESGMVVSNFSEWIELEEPNYLAVLADVDKAPPEFTRYQDGRPRVLLTHEEEHPPKEPMTLVELTRRDHVIVRCNARTSEADRKRDIYGRLKRSSLNLTHRD
jgi:hypothetical protein